MSKPSTTTYPSKIANHLVREREKEIKRLHSIIKEVREYIKNNEQYDTEFKFDFVYSDKILEILDKE